MFGGYWSPMSSVGGMSSYYTGGLGIPYMMGMGGMGYGLGASMYGMGGMGMGMGRYPYSMMGGYSPYNYSGMYGVPF